jgi:uncharacterized protein (TIGR02266 family)
MASHEEKRKYPRRNETSLVRFEGDNFAIYSNSRNMSEGGIFLNTYYLLNEGTRLNLQFEIPDSGKTVGVEGEVAWQGKVPASEKEEEAVGMGIRFIDLKMEDAQLLTHRTKDS